MAFTTNIMRMIAVTFCSDHGKLFLFTCILYFRGLIISSPHVLYCLFYYYSRFFFLVELIFRSLLYFSECEICYHLALCALRSSFGPLLRRERDLLAALTSLNCSQIQHHKLTEVFYEALRCNY